MNNRDMDLRLRLRVVLDRVQLSARELELQPEVFQATGALRQAAGDLAAILEDLETGTVAERPQRQGLNHGTGRALARPVLLAA